MRKSKTILLVDDDIFFSSIVENELISGGFKVMFSRDTSNARKILESNHIDIAILDIMFPPSKKGDSTDPNDIIASNEGFQLAKWIRQNYPDVLSIAYSHTDLEEVKNWFRKNSGAFFSKLRIKPYDLVKDYISKAMRKPLVSGPKCFIVHGHDKTMKLELKNFLQNSLGFPEPIILHEKSSHGRAIIEKFEDESEDAVLIFVLLTPDDKACNLNDTNAKKRRARQNVIFEMGYFLAKFGRKSGRVILLHSGEIELPSDIAGLVYIDISNGIEAAGEEIRREVAEFLPQKSH